MSVYYIDANELAELLRGPQRPTVVVIDVRDEDFNLGGHIAGAVNVSAHAFADPAVLDRVIDVVCGGDVDKVVLHCMMSEVRAPKAARRLAQALVARGRSTPNVFVLRRGFNRFGEMFRHDPHLVTTEWPDSKAVFDEW